MGCDPSRDTACDSDEQPVHPVSVPAFEIDKFEVTVAAYRRCVDATKCSPPAFDGDGCNWSQPGRDRHPVNCVAWIQASALCKWAGKRLCSEAEWERAARGTDGRRYAWGDAAPSCSLAVMAVGGGGCGEGATAPVGSRPGGASPYGVMDMAGNVAEWVQDGYLDSYVGAPADGTAWDPLPGGDHLRRGGSWLLGADAMRATVRFAGSMSAGNAPSIGFRCCR